MAAEPKHVHPKPRLGRGLSSLIQGPSQAIPADDQTYQHVTGLPPIASVPHQDLQAAPGKTQELEIGIDDIAPNPYQPRQKFGQEELSELTSSIAAQGILQPLIVARAAGAGVGEKTICADRR